MFLKRIPFEYPGLVTAVKLGSHIALLSRMTRWFIVISMVCLTSVWAEVYYEGEQPVVGQGTRVDHSAHFGELKAQQFRTCHIFASADLVEAAIHMRTGEHVNIGRELLIYLHIRDNLNRDILNRLVSEYWRRLFARAGFAATGEMEKGSNPGLDEGRPSETIKRIQGGNFCLEPSAEVGREFINYLKQTYSTFSKSLAEQIDSAWLAEQRVSAEEGVFGNRETCDKAPTDAKHFDHFKGEFYRKSTAHFCSAMDTKAKEAFGWGSNDRSDATIELQELSRQMQIVTPRVTHQAMRALLTKGPFVISGVFREKGKNKDRMHSAVVVGSWVSEEKVLYLIRDPGTGATHWARIDPDSGAHLEILALVPKN